MPVIRDIFPTSFITLGLKCNPTIKRRKAIPSSENIAIASFFTSKLRNNGPIKIPDKIYPIIKGCFNSLIIKDTIKTTNSTRLI